MGASRIILHCGQAVLCSSHSLSVQGMETEAGCTQAGPEVGGRKLYLLQESSLASKPLAENPVERFVSGIDNSGDRSPPSSFP